MKNIKKDIQIVLLLLFLSGFSTFGRTITGTIDIFFPEALFHFFTFFITLLFIWYSYPWIVSKNETETNSGIGINWKYKIFRIISLYILSSMLMAILTYFHHLLYKEPLEILVVRNLIANTIHLVLLTFIRSLIDSYLLKERENQWLKEQQLKIQLSELKKQLNPHFLFNTLNTLSGLIRNNHQEDSIMFIENMALVYRYVLSSEREDLVPLYIEINAVEAYIDVLHYRYKKALNIDIEEKENNNKNSLIPPLTLQLLIENAIKHNVITIDEPLKIHITINKDELTISNNYQPKKVNEDSMGIGLENLKLRYQILANQSIKVNIDQQFFIVSLPLL
ncbi:histidine kinase [Chryseobacterium sp.]|uniref:sensor histidine kinase n=1 Tax=Chryseobacterium sp. TaxID=1871047 RepID=UPI0025BD777E|nr:histidine kinase [Chryseobacterium sp.]